MKLLFYGDSPHHKNRRGIELMCQAYSIDLEFTTNTHRLQTPDYTIVIINNCFIEPSLLPPNIKIIYGPQFWPCGSIIGEYKSDYEQKYVYNSLALWNRTTLLEIYTSLVTPIVQFPYAVDIDRFHIMKQTPIYDCLVYFKRRTNVIYEKAIQIMKSMNISYTIITYGHYNESTYIDLLSKCKFVLSLDAHESQGFALEEAMSCNVPLLVLDATSLYDETMDGVNSSYIHHKPKTLYATSVPYWSDECGIKIESIDNLQLSLHKMLETYTSYTPREYVIRTLSPKMCMKRILDYFEIDTL
jgi:glycosyltransferase involved in cell wall biosynthesis